MTDRELINRAFAVMKNAYAPYSGLRIGAALECRDGRVYDGCSVESAAPASSVCAEAAAVAKAAGDGNTRFARLAVAWEGGDYCVPCGSCRQLLGEFSEDMELLCARAGGGYISMRLGEMLPRPYRR